jgi:uncharacterized protein
VKIVISGSTGMIGSALCAHFSGQGHDIVRLVRSAPEPGSIDISWHPTSGEIDAVGLEGTDAVVNLSGENLASRWTPEKKARVRDSRITTTRVLCEALGNMARPPRVLISASATGYYGDKGNEVVTEDSSPGSGFLADLCREWEAATRPASDNGTRVVNIRLGVVISLSGGMLDKLLPIFQKGLGGRLGSGRQYMPWVTLDDLVMAVDHIISNDHLSGPVNVVSPNPVTNAEFTTALARVVSRPAPFAVPAFALRLAYGEMADETLLSSCRVLPMKLVSSGFEFRYSAIEDALRHALRNQSYPHNP